EARGPGAGGAIRADYGRYRDQRRAGGLPLEPDTTAAGEPGFIDFACLLDGLWPLHNSAVRQSVTTPDDEWDARIALNAVLRGQGRAEIAADQRAKLAGDPRERQPPARRAARLANPAPPPAPAGA